MNRRSLILRAGSCLVFAALVAGCGSAASVNSPSTSGNSSAAPGSGSTSRAAQGNIPVGVVGTFSGPEGTTTGSSKLAIEAWADAVNAAGGINGRQLQLYVEDDAGNPATSLVEVKTLVQQDHVVAIVGEESISAQPWASYVESRGVPVIGGNSAELTFLTSPDFYPAGGNLLSDYYGEVALARQNGQQMANVYCAEDPACAATTTLVTGFGKPLGVSLSYSSKVAATQPDFTATCQGIKQSGASSYALGLNSATILLMVAQCAQQGVTAKPVGSWVTTSGFASTAGLDGMESADPVFPFFDDSTPATRQFQAALKKYAPSIGTAAEPLTPEVANDWVSGKLFQAAVAASGSQTVTSATVKKGLYALKGNTLGGLSAPLTFTPGKPTLDSCYYEYTITGGKFSELHGMTPQCAPDSVISAMRSQLKI
jgi:branched-chain amino acid transport system substrate-binding protein